MTIVKNRGRSDKGVSSVDPWKLNAQCFPGVNIRLVGDQNGIQQLCLHERLNILVVLDQYQEADLTREMKL